MTSEWDRLAAEDAESNVVQFPGEPPAYMDQMPPYGEPEKPLEPLALIDPSSWAGTSAPERRWKVKDYIPDGQATLLTGKGAAGKSLVSQLQATCIAMGLPFLGLEVAQTNALYITCEDDADELQRRQVAICEQLGIPIESVSGKLFLLSLQGELNNELATFTPDGRMSVAPRYKQVQDACARHEIGFLTLDNTAHLFTGNENDRHQVASFINLCNRLAIAISGAVVIVGHPNKAGDSYSGSTAWENQVRSRLFMEIPANENGEISDPDVRVMRREKVNYAQRGGELRFMWFKGSFVLPDAVPPAAVDSALNAADARDNAIFIACLETRNRQRRAVSEANKSPTYAPRVFAKMAESKGIGLARLEAAFERLYRIEVIERGFLWVFKGEGKDCHGLRIVEKNRSKIAPMTSPITSDDISVSNGKVNDINPITSNQDVIGANVKNGGKPSDNIADDIPMTSDDIADDIPPLPKGEGRGAPSILGMGGTPTAGTDADAWLENPILNPSAIAEPPAWMDEAPPFDPFAHNPPSNDDDGAE